jgi:ubiquinone/menaquinone biosynthesis C-methylase UbiE
MKDNFSARSEKYARFRPSYPQEFYDLLVSLVDHKVNAWDCGTGNGQIAIELSKYFTTVYATDISEKQIMHAAAAPNIFYKVANVEEVTFPDNFFDLITVGQALHWFHFDEFYKVVNRTLKDDGLFAAIGYGIFRTGDDTDKVVDHYYTEITGPYWDEERHYIDESYQTIPFPFEEIKVPMMKTSILWSFEQLIGYLETWSAAQHYIKKEGKNPIELIIPELERTWPKGIKKEITFTFFLRVGRKQHSH